MTAGTTYTTDDPFNSAMNPVAPTQDRTYFGEVVTVDAWHCVLEKGKGKRLFDASIDDINQRSTAITIKVECDKRDGGTYTVDQEALDWQKEWREFTLPSLRQLGIDLRNLKGKFVQCKRQATGETYTKKDTGEVKTKSALVFIAEYPSKEAMKAASEVFYTPRNGAATPAAAAAPADDGEYAFAVQTLAMLWKAVKEDEDKFLQAITNNPMLTKYFDANSDEVKKFTLGF